VIKWVEAHPGYGIIYVKYKMREEASAISAIKALHLKLMII